MEYRITKRELDTQISLEKKNIIKFAIVAAVGFIDVVVFLINGESFVKNIYSLPPEINTALIFIDGVLCGYGLSEVIKSIIAKIRLEEKKENLTDVVVNR